MSLGFGVLDSGFKGAVPEGKARFGVWFGFRVSGLKLRQYELCVCPSRKCLCRWVRVGAVFIYALSHV
jgi:hypothetical protein